MRPSPAASFIAAASLGAMLSGRPLVARAADDPQGGGNAGAGHAHGGGAQDIFQPPEDTEREDSTLPAGSIVVELRDADERPVPGENVTLGALINSIAKGDTRKHYQATTSTTGEAAFAQLDTASNVAYRVSCGYQGGAFAAQPFQLGPGKAMRVVLHVYPVTRSLSTAAIASQVTVAVEVRDDRLQVEEGLTIFNLGRSAWQPDGVSMSLPSGVTGFNAQASMSDQGVDQDGESLKLHGTFGPGQHQIEFRWQLPWSGEAEKEFSVGLPPHAAIVQALMPAFGSAKLSVADFPPADTRRNSRGQPFWVTERRLRPDDNGDRSLEVRVSGLPTPGPGRIVATLLAAAAVAAGLGLCGLWGVLSGIVGGREPAQADKRPARAADPKAVRKSLLAEVLELERARASGDVGVKTYERARRELVDLLASALATGRAK